MAESTQAENFVASAYAALGESDNMTNLVRAIAGTDFFA